MGVERVQIALAGERQSASERTLLARGKLPFRSVNAPGTPGYNPGMQRHHILPRQVARKSCFSRLVQDVGEERMAMDDFRSNGLLLPSLEQASQILGLPLHRGPHGRYNEVVIERFGQIEAHWQRERLRNADRAALELLLRMRLLQQALRRALLQPARRLFRLNRRDPAWRTLDFSDLDAMADVVWTQSSPPDR
jgi:hypothetical protein